MKVLVCGGKGVKMMVELAKKAGVPVKEYKYENHTSPG